MPHGEIGYMIPSDQQERLRELLGLDMGSLSPGPSDEDGKIGGIRARVTEDTDRTAEGGDGRTSDQGDASLSDKPALILTVGLPRSGKTTWALDMSHSRCYPIVNPDSIRLALHGQPFIAEAEPFVWAVAKTMVRALFLAGHQTVIVDATNISRKRRDEWKSSQWERQFKVFDMSAEDCQERAEETERPDLVPVIDRMAAEYEPVGEDEGIILL